MPKDLDFQITDVSLIKNKIYVSGYSLITGEKIIFDINSFPNLALYVQTKKETKYKSYLGSKNLERINFNTISEYKEFIEKHSDIQNFHIYGEFPLERQFYSEFYPNEFAPNISLVNVGYFDIETEADDDAPDADLALKRITAITIYSTKSKKYYVFSDKKTTKKYFKEDSEWDNLKDNIVFYEFTPNFIGEFKMLKMFCYVVNNIEKFDILTAYFGNTFDFKYIYNRIERLCLNKDNYEELEDDDFSVNYLSPLKSAYKTTKGNIYIKGIQFIDYAEIYKKYDFEPLESRRLNYISQIVLGEEKVEKEGSFTEFYNNNYEKYLYYNFHDVRLLKKIEEKRRYMDLHIEISYIAKQNFSDTISPVRTWETIFYNYLKPKNIIFNPIKENYKKKFLGAYTHEPTPGFYNYIISLDLNSLYPHLIMQYFMSPETIVSSEEIRKKYGHIDFIVKLLDIRDDLERISNETPYDKDKVALAYDSFADRLLSGEFKGLTEFLVKNNLTMTPSIEFFKKDDSAVLPFFMQNFYDMRKLYKKKQLKLEEEVEKIKDKNEIAKLEAEIVRNYLKQMAFKIFLNSAYGALGNEWFRFFDIRIAKSITASGRFAIRSLMKHFRNKLNKIYESFTGKKPENVDFFVYGDTDSSYLTLEKFIPIIIYLYRDIIKYFMYINNKIYLEDEFFENICHKFDSNDEIIIKYFQPHDMYRKKNGLIEELCFINVIDNKEKIDFLLQKFNKKILMKRKSDKGIVYIIENIDDKIKKEFKENNIDFYMSYVLDDFINTVIQDIIEENYTNIAKLLNGKNKMVMKRESICINGIWVGKKNYILNVIDKENVRYAEPKLKPTGIIKTKTPKQVRDNVKKFLQLLISFNDPFSKESKKIMDEKISEFKKEFLQISPELTGINTQVNNITKFIDKNGTIVKGTPINSYAAIVYNKYIEEKGLKGFVPIHEGEKMRYVYLKEPNMLGSHVFGYKDDDLPDEIKPLVDMNVMLEKTYYDMLGVVLDEIGLSLGYSRKSANILDVLE